MQKGFAPVLILVGILVIMVVAGGAYFFGKFQGLNLRTPIPVVTSQTPSPKTSASSPVPNGTGETANWKTYTNTKYGFSFKYPEGYFFEELMDFTGRWEQDLGIFNVNVTTNNPKPGGGYPIPHVEIWIYRMDASTLEDWILKHISTTEPSGKIDKLNPKIYWRLNNKVNSILDNQEAVTFDAIRGESGDYKVTLTVKGGYVIGIIIDRTNDQKDPQMKNYYSVILATFKFIP